MKRLKAIRYKDTRALLNAAGLNESTGGTAELPGKTGIAAPLERTWIRSEWEGYYTQADSGFNVMLYFQRATDFIPTQTTCKHRFDSGLIEFLEKEGVAIDRRTYINAANKHLFNQGHFLYKEMIVQSFYREDSSDYKVVFYHHPSLKAPIEDFMPFLVKKKENRISVLLHGKYEGYYSEPCDMTVPKMDLALNYGDSFASRHPDLVRKLKDEKSGLYIFYGVAGSGKSTMIKHLSGLVGREFIYIPVGMVHSLATPEMMAFMMTKKNAILVLEDAEKVVRSRDVNDNSDVVSTLLNVSDGILGNVLNISIIATYNAERETVDKAFLRKGRLKFEHEFTALSLVETNRLLTHLKLPSGTKPMTLAEIYNLEDDTGHITKEERRMGFGA